MSTDRAEEFEELGNSGLLESSAEPNPSKWEKMNALLALPIAVKW